MTNRINFLVAATLSVFAATGCATELAPCEGDACVALEQADYDNAPDMELNDAPTRQADVAPDREIRLAERFPGIEIERWAYRLVQGEREACDMQVADFFGGRIDAVSLEGCEGTVLETLADREFVAVEVDATADYGIGSEGTRPDAEHTNPVRDLSVEETTWIFLGLDAVDGVDLTAAQERLIVDLEANELGEAPQGDIEVGRRFAYEAPSFDPQFVGR